MWVSFPGYHFRGGEGKHGVSALIDWGLWDDALEQNIYWCYSVVWYFTSFLCVFLKTKPSPVVHNAVQLESCPSTWHVPCPKGLTFYRHKLVLYRVQSLHALNELWVPFRWEALTSMGNTVFQSMCHSCLVPCDSYYKPLSHANIPQNAIFEYALYKPAPFLSAVTRYLILQTLNHVINFTYVRSPIDINRLLRVCKCL